MNEIKDTKVSCANCIWYDGCRNTEKVCDNYSPIEQTDEDIEIIIEENRKEFYEKWQDYITEDENDCYYD
jgi:hypothetical protein